MPHGKYPGPDGFIVEFFKACWSKFKQNMLQLFEASRKISRVHQALNVTFLTLIPKKDGTLDPSQFRSISICNAVYNIITKVIANRIKSLLHALIVEEQTRYVEGRQTLDGIFWLMRLSIPLNLKRGPTSL